MQKAKDATRAELCATFHMLALDATAKELFDLAAAYSQQATIIGRAVYRDYEQK